MNTSIKYIVFASLLVTMLVSAFSADAGLITRRGTTIGTDSYNETVQLHDMTTSVFNDIGYESGSPISSYSRNSYFDLVYATPKDDCHWNEVYDPFTNEFYRTACSYEYAYGEEISFFGSRDFMLPGAMQYEVLWTITGNGHSSEYSSSYFDTLNVDLDLTIPTLILAPGVYEVALRLTINAGADQQFFQFSEYEDDVQCAVQGPVGTPETCGLTGSLSSTWTRAGTTSLLIATEPTSVLLIMIGVFGLLSFRQRG